MCRRIDEPEGEGKPSPAMSKVLALTTKHASRKEKSSNVEESGRARKEL